MDVVANVPPPASAAEIVACAARLFDTTPRDIWQPSKHTHIVEARWAVWWTLRFYGYSGNRIAKLFGKNHTTVLYGLRRAAQLMAADYTYTDRIAILVALRDEQFLAWQRKQGCNQSLSVLDPRQTTREASRTYAYD